MVIEFKALPYDVKLRMIRARAQELCDHDPVFNEMLMEWQNSPEVDGRITQYVTTRVVEIKRF